MAISGSNSLSLGNAASFVRQRYAELARAARASGPTPAPVPTVSGTLADPIRAESDPLTAEQGGLPAEAQHRGTVFGYSANGASTVTIDMGRLVSITI